VGTHFKGFGMRFLLAAVLWSLMVPTAFAHLGHGHRSDGAKVIAVDAVVTAVHRAVTQEAQAMAVPAISLDCGPCGGHCGCCAAAGCGPGSSCSSVSCAFCGAAALLLPVVGLAPTGNSATACDPNRLLSGEERGPSDRPPRS